MRQVLAAPHESTQLISIEIRHQGIRDYNVNLVVEQKLHRLQPITRRSHFISRSLKHNLEISPQRRIVLDQQDTLVISWHF